MKTGNIFSGTGVALVTPFSANGAIDFAALARIIEHCIAGGVDYLLALGTTSESPTMTTDERIAVARFIKDRVRGRLPIIIGIGGNCTREVITTLNSGITDGYDGILSVCPYYNKPNQEGIYRHFCAISKASPLPILLYNIPGRTGVNILPETVARIAASCPNVVGIKEASGKVDQAARIVALLPATFSVISGDDALTVDIMRHGGCGVISVVAQLYPSSFTKMVNLAMQGLYDEADALLEPMSPVISDLFAEGNPTGIKAALSQKGLCENVLRLPLVEASATLQQHIAEAFVTYEKC